MDVNKLCISCMNEAKRSPCNICGFDCRNYMMNYLKIHHLPPMTILNGKYLVGRVLGEGGFGITYIALDLNLNLKLAIKEYYPSGYVMRDRSKSNHIYLKNRENTEFFQIGMEKFLKEGRTLAKFAQAPGIVRVIDYFRENSTAYIVMEYIEGFTLKRYLKDKQGKLPLDYTLNLMQSVISTLSLVHEHGVIHRDIAPDNIMIDSFGTIKLIDFGAAKDAYSKSGEIVLKKGFAPVEQYFKNSNQGPWTDVYALCATIYKVVSGITPQESVERKKGDRLAPLFIIDSQIPVGISNVISKGMQIDYKERIKDMKELYRMIYSRPITQHVNTSFLFQPDINSNQNKKIEYNNQDEIRQIKEMTDKFIQKSKSFTDKAKNYAKNIINKNK